MNIKLGQLVAKTPSLEALVSTKLSAVAAFRLAKDVRLINDELTTYNTAHNDLIKKYGSENEDGNYQIKADDPKFQDYAVEETELLNEEVDLDIQQVKLNELGNAFEIEPKFMADLIDFIIIE